MSTARSSPAISALRQPAEHPGRGSRGPSIDCAVYMLDSAGNVATWNSVAERMTGYKAEEIIGRHVSLLYPAEEVSAGVPQVHLQRALAEGRWEEEVQRLRRDGSPFRAVLSVIAQFDRMNAHSGFAVAMNELGREPTHAAVDSSTLDHLAREQAHQHAERKLHSEKLFSDTMIESMPGVFYFYDAAGRFLRWNRNFETVSGYSAREIARMHPLDFFADQNEGAARATDRGGVRERRIVVEAEFVARDGSLKPYFFTGRRAATSRERPVWWGWASTSRSAGVPRIASRRASASIASWWSTPTASSCAGTPKGASPSSTSSASASSAIPPRRSSAAMSSGTIVPPTESGGRDLQRLIREHRRGP